MSSHLARMQYQQQKIGSLGRIESSSSLRSVEQLQAPSISSFHNSEQLPVQEPSNSIVSGSYLSSRSRSQLSTSGNIYQNIKRSGRLPESVFTQSAAIRNNEGASLISAEQNTRTGSALSYQPSTVLTKSVQGNRSLYTLSQMRMSRSLKASKASLATYKSGRTTIQAEHHDRKVQREINSVKFGRARKLYWIAVLFYTLFLLVLFIGLLIICLRHVYMNIILSLDVGEATGPLLVACSFLFFGAGMKFYYDAYRLGSEERKRVKYKAASPSTVAVTTVTQRTGEQEEKLITGQTSENALSRAPIGSRTTLLVP